MDKSYPTGPKTFMKRDIQKLTQEQYDVLVVGGGINGAAIAHMAALNGLKVALLEKGDFASGTSSKSTKLIHGGLRYLENLEFGLVCESLKERFIQLKSAPHLVHPLRFIIPVYKSDKRPFWMMKFGVWLYDLLGQRHRIEKSQTLNVEEVCRRIPGIKREGLLGGVAYSDAQMNDARLCLENILSASQKGAHVANYVKVRALIKENDRIVGVEAYDSLSCEAFEVKAKRVVCAVGPWANVFLRKEDKELIPQVRTTKGIHIVYRGRISDHAILIPARQDNRVFFIIPWMENSLIGTTDTDFTGHPDAVAVKQEDINYLMGEADRVLPDCGLKKENIIMTFAGLRPLIGGRGHPSKVSRKHAIRISPSGVVFVMGGKYTTYRRIAEDVVSGLVKKELVDTQKEFPVYGSGIIKENPEVVGRQYGLKEDVVQSLMDFYGIRFRDVLALLEGDAGLKEPICTCSLVIRAQIVYAIQTEMACSEKDILMRRLVLGYNNCQDGGCRRVVQHILTEMKS